MTVSVIIPSYNGARKLPDILGCIANQTLTPDEIVVVIDGSTDDTLAVLELEKKKLPQLKIVSQQNGGRSKVRNKGAREASGELLIFFDDDMLPAIDCIAVHLAHHLSNPGSILTGAQIDVENEHFKDFRNYKAYLSKKWSAALEKQSGNALNKENLFLTAANFSISAITFFAYNGFDERLTDAEDYDFAVRANNNGTALYYDHNAFAFHQDVVSCRTYIKRMRQYSLAQHALNSFNPGLISKYTVKTPTYFKAQFFKSFCHNFWISSIDADFWKKVLPRTLRYKLYDWVITANGSFFPEKLKV